MVNLGQFDDIYQMVRLSVIPLINSLPLFQEFACNGTVVEHPEYGEVLQLQGDQRHNVCDWLTKVGLVKADQLKVHGNNSNLVLSRKLKAC